MPRAPERVLPTRLEAFLFTLKVHAFRLKRAGENGACPVARLPRRAAGEADIEIARSRTALWSDSRVAERTMQRGKVHNLRMAARALDGTSIAPGALFSFWRQVGPPTRARGYVAGRMLQEGCLVSSPGGGLCQLSNALYDVALQAGCEIVERHAHSRLVPGSAAWRARDATVAWNYVDLRFRSLAPLHLKVTLDEEFLTVSLWGATTTGFCAPAVTDLAKDESRQTARDCATCGEDTCFRHRDGAGEDPGVTAFLVDEHWREFDDVIASARKDGDILCLPIDGRRWRKPNYAWTTGGLRTVTAPAETLQRALASRRLAAQGAARQLQLQTDADRLAARFARCLGPDVTEIYVTQAFLPWLWRNGHLGGRRFHVLMTRLPLAVLHARLDAAACAHPARGTLADFRADPGRVVAEADALAAARTILAPHREIAALFGSRSRVLDWHCPPAEIHNAVPRRRVIAFPGPAVARKGAYELREAVRGMHDVEIAVLGRTLEGTDFWDGLPVRAASGADWLAGVGVVVQPALVEDRPRRLLQALRAGIPVIATPACGLPPQDGLTLIAPGDAGALRRAIEDGLPD